MASVIDPTEGMKQRMASLIDPSKPTVGNATTDSVRKNFQFAKQDIEYMQNQIAALLDRVVTLETNAAKMLTTDGGTILGDLNVDGNATFNGPVAMKSTTTLGVMPVGDMEAVPKSFIPQVQPVTP